VLFAVLPGLEKVRSLMTRKFKIWVSLLLSLGGGGRKELMKYLSELQKCCS
jgi:hypothetical protein